jgi:hypothetical protein
MVNLHQIPKSKTFQEKANTILIGYALCIILTILITFVANHLFDKNPFLDAVDLERPNKGGLFFLAIISAPLWEEIKWRVFPIQVSRFLPKELVWPIVLFASIDFGLSHGNVFNIYIQGIHGLIFSYVYIKNNYSYFSSVFLHCIFNLSVIYLLPYTLTHW